jgi:tryptophan synthase alpha chain
MERFARVFARKSRKVLVAYLCVGDPSEEESVALAGAATEAGADVLELGVPFSDPTADGPAIARASQRAIARGGGLASTLRAARAIRAKNADVPIVLFGYYNPIFVHGEARVVAEAAGIVDALLVVDLPIEEAEPLRSAAAASHIGLVPLLTPTSSPDRVDAVRRANARHPVGFVYYVSVAGVTGSAAAPLADASVEAGKLREALGLPVVVGFGIDSGAKARAAGAHADGVVVGTALVRTIEDGKTREEREAAVRSCIGELRAGLDAC